jgi:hypothetical protein
MWLIKDVADVVYGQCLGRDGATKLNRRSASALYQLLLKQGVSDHASLAILGKTQQRRYSPPFARSCPLRLQPSYAVTQIWESAVRSLIGKDIAMETGVNHTEIGAHTVVGARRAPQHTSCLIASTSSGSGCSVWVDDWRRSGVEDRKSADGTYVRIPESDLSRLASPKRSASVIASISCKEASRLPSASCLAGWSLR